MNSPVVCTTCNTLLSRKDTLNGCPCCKDPLADFEPEGGYPPPQNELDEEIEF